MKNNNNKNLQETECVKQENKSHKGIKRICKMNEKWSYEEVSEEEFDTHRKIENYYRIFYIKDDKENNVFKFWAKNDEEAVKVLKEYCDDHRDRNDYFYSTSGYYISLASNKRYDTMEEMHNDFKNEQYDVADREYDIEKISTFKDNYSNSNNIDTLNKLKDELHKIEQKISEYENSSKNLISEIDKLDLNTEEEKVMDDISNKSIKINDIFYELREIEYLIRTKHNLNEKWNLNDHILEDLRYNLTKMIENKNGYPCQYNKKAADILGLTLDKNYELCDESKYDELSNKASELWNNELKYLLDCIIGYFYFTSYGIYDKSETYINEFAKEHKNEIPYKIGTYKEIDYIKLEEISNSYWNKIWDWIKENGKDLWD